MKIVFALTKKDIWWYQRNLWLPSIMRITTWFSALSLLSIAVCYVSGLGFPLGIFLAAVLCVMAVMLFGQRVLSLLQTMVTVTSAQVGERIAEIGSLDFRWGGLKSSGYYYHWTYLVDVRDDGSFLCFMLPRGHALLIPKSAFSTPADAEKFLALALVRWETAKMNQQYAMSGSGEGIWPPPPRIEVK